MNMMDYIEEQASLFPNVLADRKKVAAPFVKLFGEHTVDQIYLIASGTSFNAASTAAPFMETVLKLPVTVLAPSKVCKLSAKHPAAVVISQGGNSTNTLNVFRYLEGIPTLVMTGNPYGHANSKGDLYAEIPCGEEAVGPKTKGYTMTILALYLMALEAGKETGILSEEQRNEYLAVLEQAAQWLPENISRAKAWAQDNLESLMRMRVVYAAGKRQGEQIAAEGALKLMETVLIPGLSYEFEELLHGPASSIDDKISGFYLLPVPKDPDYERMQRLVEYHREISDTVYTVGLSEGKDKRDCVVKTTGEWYTQPFEEILPMQVASSIVPEKLNIVGVGSQSFRKLDPILGIKAPNEKGIQ